MDETNINATSKQIAALMFTDIVGSVALQQKLGTNSYTRYVARHDEIIKDCLSNVPDSKICRIIGTTKKTIQSIKDRSYWNIQNLRAQNPAELGLCSRQDLEKLVIKYKDVSLKETN